MSNAQELADFIARQEPGTKLKIATSQYAYNTTPKGFYFDFHSTAQAVRGAIKKGLITGSCGWRYYDVTVV